MLGVNPDNRVELIESAATLSRWPAQAAAAVDRMPDLPRELFVDVWWEQVTAAVGWAQNWGHAMPSLTGHYDQSTLMALRYTVDQLHRGAPEPTITSENLKGLLELVRQTIDSVTNDADLPRPLRNSS